MSTILALALASATIPISLDPPAPLDPCRRFDQEVAEGPAHAVTARDLAELADIGRSDPNEAPSPFGVSPDNTQIAFVVRRGNPEANGYCERLMVVPFDRPGPARELDRGGEYIRDTFDLRNFTAIGAGWVRVITPKWSPDGHTIAFLKRKSGSTQVWLAEAQGGAPARRATDMPDDVEDFSWTRDGTGLIVATRPALREEAEAIASEAPGGFLFDERFFPSLADQPLPTAPHPLEYVHWSLRDGTRQAASAQEVALLAPVRPAAVPPNARMFAAGPGGAAAWAEPKQAGQIMSPSQLVLTDPQGRRVTCVQAMCAGARRLWWASDGRTLYAVLVNGWAKSQSRILTWRVGDPAPREVLATDDMLIGCAKPGREIVCAREGTTRPRRLVAIDPHSGRERLIYDPNPEFARLKIGPAQRLRFRNAYGVESYADLVLPPDHRPGQRHPLVVVQYLSYGFLRGGTGDEFPVQALAGRGFAVLSFNRPDFVPSALQAGNETASMAANRKDWIDRRNVQSSLELALQSAIETGTVDPDRMGISGFSDGASTVQWALINSALFKVAALGSCCEGFEAYPLAAGPSFERIGRDIGYRFFEPGAAEFWKPMSLLLNADRINTPILIQTGDSEYESGLDVFAAFRQRGTPIELYVLNDEGHIKWQPAHRLAIYQRSIEWFEFWLMGRMDCDPAKAAQYKRWLAMKGAPTHPVCVSVPSALP